MWKLKLRKIMKKWDDFADKPVDQYEQEFTLGLHKQLAKDKVTTQLVMNYSEFVI